MFSVDRLLLLLSLALLPSFRVAGQDQLPERESVNFVTAVGYRGLRGCAVCCFETTGCFFYEQVTRVLGCDLNSCICSRTDIRSLATKHLSSCVAKSCSGVSGDVSDAISVFNGYCDKYLGETVPTSDGGGGEGSPETITVVERTTVALRTVTTTLETATVEVAATTITVFPSPGLEKQEPQSTVTLTSSSGLSESGKIGLGVGLGIGIPAFAVIAFLAYRFTRALTTPPEMPQPIQGSYVG